MKTKQFVATSVRAVEGAERALRFTVSTDSVDRYNDTISASGWMLDNFKRNPVILFGHDYGALPVGRALSVDRVAPGLEAVIQFAPPAVDDFADKVYKMCAGGFLKACSVGFDPIESRPNSYGGTDFIRQELLEVSIVPVGANAEALAKSAAGRRGAVAKSEMLSDMQLANLFNALYDAHQAGKIDDATFAAALNWILAGINPHSKAAQVGLKILEVLKAKQRAEIRAAILEYVAQLLRSTVAR